MNIITYKEVLELDNYILIDVRTPKEFVKEPIVGAVNIPVLLDEERVIVGTTYVQQSKELAKELGINFISKRLPEIFKQVQELSKKYRRLIFFCARGGMRSGSMASLFSSLGYRASKLEGGYKAYREYIAHTTPEVNKDFKYIVLHGRTGIGKTKILNRLEELGYPVMDLEKMADHKGSFFGNLCEKRQQSQKRFESEIFHFLLNNKKNYILAESESKRIGDAYIPESVYESLVSGYHLMADTTLEHRIEVLMEDYADASKEELKASLMKVGRYVSKKNLAKYMELLEKNQLTELATDLVKEYYDPLYQKSIDKYMFNEHIFYSSTEEGVQKVIEFLKLHNFE
ncbi:MAG: tRNA 2-selenouridine(34) synthase MnmH [Fusobacterium sp.]|nr:tRNA 2-selenouridine(34) synthase MnmH [Fusobacterium sp.]